MSLITRYIPNIFQNLSNVQATNSVVAGGVYNIFIRTKIRCYFPRPSERKRIKRHGWWQRMGSIEGRRILMRRILKGRHALSH